MPYAKQWIPADMRLKPEEHTIVVNAIAAKDAHAQTYLFGSRANDTAKGGDIDLLVMSKRISLIDKLDILATLHHKLGNRKIDLLIQKDITQPFAQLALQSGVRL